MNIPTGWKLVPVEPTPEMKTAGISVEVYPDSPPELACLTWAEAKAIYQAMLDAAPTLPAPLRMPEPDMQSAWISVQDRMPPDDTPVLVYVPGNEMLAFAIDQWQMQREAPLDWSSATIETGMGWGDHDYEDVSHWMPLTAPDHRNRGLEASEGVQRMTTPKGWKLVPDFPTPGMCDALRVGSSRDVPSDQLCEVRYRSMLASAPTPPTPPVQQDDEALAVLLRIVAASDDLAPDRVGALGERMGRYIAALEAARALVAKRGKA